MTDKTDQLIQAARSSWCRAFEIDQVSDDQNFFALGGDSLAALGIALEVEEALQMPVDAADLF